MGCLGRSMGWGERRRPIAGAFVLGGFTGPQARGARLRGLVSLGCGALLVAPRCRAAGSTGRGRSMGGWASPSSQGWLGWRRPLPGTGPSPRLRRARRAPRALCQVLCGVWARGAGGFHGCASCSFLVLGRGVRQAGWMVWFLLWPIGCFLESRDSSCAWRRPPLVVRAMGGCGVVGVEGLGYLVVQRQLVMAADRFGRRARRCCETANAPPRPTSASPRPPAAPIPASPQSKLPS